ncbi:retrograde regulation protein 2 [Rhizodiscina lignyota]|uniref:Retrograde regulation protein 2 n=1 Tax=Rhizodiscina lignyota TaxID=1504668 RepID=A0A9P4I786_9PEZI|nr:retrograde regulation protein 2 [Rhizodiscina lignyota]
MSQEKPEIIHEEALPKSSTTDGYVPETAPEYTAEEEAKVIRKLDWNMIPLLFTLYTLSVLDRTNLGNARIAGMEKDIDLNGNRYNWLGTMFYIGYVLFQWIQIGWKAFPPHIWVAFCVFGWGTVSSCQAAAQGWGGLMVCRFLLAFFECGYGPGVPLYLSYFYPREKIAFRTGIFLAGSAAANAYGGALAYGISQAKGAIAPWRILFLVEGLPTVALSAVVFFFVPDGPHNARFLTEREKEIAVDISLRQPGDRTGNKGLQLKQLAGAFLDWRSYLPAFGYFGSTIPFASLPLFAPTIISQMGAFTTIQSNGLTAPPYVLTFICIVGTCYISDKIQIRGPFIAGWALIAAIGYILLATQTSVAARYAGLFLAPLCFVSIALSLSWVANMHATDSKRAGGLTILATIGQMGTFIATNIFPLKDAPYYRVGMWISCGGCLITTICGTAQVLLLMRENRKRDQLYGENRDTIHLEHPTEFGHDAQFRYMI